MDGVKQYDVRCKWMYINLLLSSNIWFNIKNSAQGKLGVLENGDPAEWYSPQKILVYLLALMGDALFFPIVLTVGKVIDLFSAEFI